MAKDDEDILKIRDEDLLANDTPPAKAFLQTPPALSSARTERVPPEDAPLSRQAPYEQQFADRIARLNRPRKPGKPPWKQGWVYLVLVAGVLFPLLLRAVINNRQQQKSRDQKRVAQEPEKRPFRGPGGWQFRPHELVNEDAQQAQMTFLQGLAAIDNKDYDEAIRLFTVYLKDNKAAVAYQARGIAYYSKKEYVRAIDDYAEAIRLDPNHAATLNNVAWVLATCPNDKVRDGNKAVQYGTKACAVSGWKNSSSLDTLAAAHAESGNFKEAVKWQQRAIHLGIEGVGEPEKARERLKLYEQGKPYREK